MNIGEITGSPNFFTIRFWFSLGRTTNGKYMTKKSKHIWPAKQIFKYTWKIEFY